MSRNELVVLVSGWRLWPWPMRHYIWSDLRVLHDAMPSGWTMVVRHGGNRRGVDMIADQYAQRRERCRPQPVPATWREHDDLCGTVALGNTAGERWCPGASNPVCLRAGDRRNALMCAMEPEPGYALAYPGPSDRLSGTRNCMRHMRERGIPGLYRSFEHPDLQWPLASST